MPTMKLVLLQLFLVLMFSLTSIASTPRAEVVGSAQVDLGSFAANEAKKAVFEIRNTGDTVLHIPCVRKTCGCFELECSKTVLPPGESGKVTVSVLSESLSGTFDKHVFVETDDPALPEIHLRVYGEAKPLLEILPQEKIRVGRIPSSPTWKQEVLVKPLRGGVQLGTPVVEGPLELSLANDPSMGWRLVLRQKGAIPGGPFRCVIRLPVIQPTGWKDVEILLTGEIMPNRSLTNTENPPAKDPPKDPQVVPENAWVIFASGDCKGCEWLKDTWLPAFRRMNQGTLPPLRFVNLDNDGGYEALMSVEKRLSVKIRGDAFPVLLVGNRMLYGEKEIGKALNDNSASGWLVPLDSDVRKYLVQTSGVPLSEFEWEKIVPEQSKKNESRTGPNIQEAASGLSIYRQARILCFVSPGCSGCSRAMKQVAFLRRQHPGVEVVVIDALEPKGRTLQMAVANRLGIPRNRALLAPMFTSGTMAYAKDETTDEHLAGLFAEASAAPFWQSWDEKTELAKADTLLKAMGREMTVGLVVAGGLIDGINPCAFAAVVFLISCLSLGGGHGRRHALVFGGLFCAGVFCCYLLLGLGLTSLLEHLQAFKGTFQVFTLGMAGLCLFFAIASFRDAWLARKHGASAMEFGVPRAITQTVHHLVRNQTGRGVLGIGAFGLGMLVSALELVCTGQIYLPVLAFINAATPGGRSIALLLVYNLAFILPLVLVTLVGVFGPGTPVLVRWGRDHAAATKVAMGLLLLGLGTALVLLR